MPQHRQFKRVVGQNAVDPNIHGVLPVLRNIPTDCYTSNECSLPFTSNSFHLSFWWQISEVNPISIRCGERLRKFFNIVGDSSGVSVLRCSFDSIPHFRFRDRSADEQQLVQHLVFFSQSHDFLFNAFCLQIDCNQNIVLLILCHQLQNFINRWHFLPSELWIKPTARIKAADFFQR
jgi:hypothetical protein